MDLRHKPSYTIIPTKTPWMPSQLFGLRTAHTAYGMLSRHCARAFLPRPLRSRRRPEVRTEPFSGVLSLKKAEREAAAQRRPAKSREMTALFPRNDRPYGLKRFAYQTEKALGSVTLILQIISIYKAITIRAQLAIEAGLPRVPDSSPGKSALGKGWGAWGEGEPLPRRRRPKGGPQGRAR